MGEMIKSSRLGSGKPARVGTGSVPWVGPGGVGGWIESIGGRVANEPLMVATPPGNKVGLDIGKDTGVGGGWVEATGGRITKESLKAATPLGDKVGPEVGASTAVDVGGGTVGRVAGIDLHRLGPAPTGLGPAPRLTKSQPDF